MKVKSGRRGFSFHLLEERPYTRRDGSLTTIKVWRGYCRDCRDAFEISTPAAVQSSKDSHAFQVRRCKACRIDARISP